MKISYNLYINYNVESEQVEELRIDKITHNYKDYGKVEEPFKTFQIYPDRVKYILDYINYDYNQPNRCYYRLTHEEYLRTLFYLKTNFNYTTKDINEELIWDIAKSVDYHYLIDIEEMLCNTRIRNSKDRLELLNKIFEEVIEDYLRFD